MSWSILLGKLEVYKRAYLKLGVASKNNLRSLSLIQEGRVGHGHSLHVVVLPTHPHLLGKGAVARHY